MNKTTELKQEIEKWEASDDLVSTTKVRLLKAELKGRKDVLKDVLDLMNSLSTKRHRWGKLKKTLEEKN